MRTRLNNNYLKNLIWPILLAWYPAIYLYNSNAEIINLYSITIPLIVFGLVGVIIYTGAWFIAHKHPIKAVNAAYVMLVFFLTYGLLFDFSKRLDLIQIEHFWLLPPILVLCGYCVFFILKLKMKVARSLQQIVGIILIGLVVFNLFGIVMTEIRKNANRKIETVQAEPIPSSLSSKNMPDVYYLMFDEFAGFNAMREYWGYQEVDEFVNYLQTKGFFVAQNSRANSIDTLHQMSQRLNYQQVALEDTKATQMFAIIANNHVMQDFKALGYTTISFNEIVFGYPAMIPISADVVYEYGKVPSSQTMTSRLNLIDEFGILVADNTMLRIFSNQYRNTLETIFVKHYDMVQFTASQITRLDEIPGPKFVYSHLLLPHYPFMFTENGKINRLADFYNWNSYLDQYKYTIKLSENMIDGILANSDPDNPPIIILQSDHGARNIVVTGRNGVGMNDYPEEYKTDIMNAMYLPGYDYSQLPDDINPVNTFPIILNHYFKMDIPLVK